MGGSVTRVPGVLMVDMGTVSYIDALVYAKILFQFDVVVQRRQITHTGTLRV